MHILIAEDEATIARALKVMLERNKYAVDVVDNGKDALDYIRAAGYDALVLDIMMPVMDGLAVLREARAPGITDARTVSDGESGNRRPRDGAGRGCGRLSAEAL